MIDPTLYGPYQAHLNGGPMDDEFIKTPAGQRAFPGGRYVIRSVDGDPVPHGTSGEWIEFDWVPA